MATASNANSTEVTQDKNCWFCHEPCSKHRCSTCFRSFHDKCLRSTNKIFRMNSENVLTCPVCLSLKYSEKLFIGKQSILDNLKHVKDEILKFVNFSVLFHLPDWTEPSYSSKIVNPINLNDVFEKIDTNTYASLDAFLTDIDCLFHNSVLHYGKRQEIPNTVDDLIDFCTFECECISSCVNCYENYYSLPKSEWRTKVCEAPHLILWAKLDRKSDFWPAKKGFTYWPAKLLAINDDDLKIIYFGYTEYEDIRSQGCYLYSTTVPSPATKSSANQKDMESALKEVDTYIENVENKFQIQVNKGLSNILLNRRQVGDQIKAMFLGYTDQVVEEDGTENDAKNDENIDTISHEVPAKRARFSHQETIAPDVADLTFVPDNSADTDGSSEDTDDDLSESMAKIHDEVKNLNSSNKRKIHDLQTELKRYKDIHAKCQGKNDELHHQLNIAAQKQAKELAELKDSHNKEFEAIKEEHNKKIAELKNAQNTDLEAQLKAKETEMVKLRETNSKQEMELRITTNFLEKARQDVDTLKKCTGCKKRLDRRCATCNAIWAEISIKSEPNDASSEISINSDDD